ncbi:MAG TPA: hypothetical protein VFK03_01765 [Candidatus Saccharimonadales bacterium]|nr:hypothetical protein [Candidatus Saccharimonadales bacterium]
MNESDRPHPSKSDEAVIRDMMDKKGISFEEARRRWEITKADVALKALKNRKKEK